MLAFSLTKSLQKCSTPSTLACSARTRGIAGWLKAISSSCHKAMSTSAPWLHGTGRAHAEHCGLLDAAVILGQPDCGHCCVGFLCALWCDQAEAVHQGWWFGGAQKDGAVSISLLLELPFPQGRTHGRGTQHSVACTVLHWYSHLWVPLSSRVVWQWKQRPSLSLHISLAHKRSHQASCVCSSFFSATCAQDRSGMCPLPAQLPFCLPGDGVIEVDLELLFSLCSFCQGGQTPRCTGLGADESFCCAFVMA